MPLHHAVLALLADKPAHGYELKISLEEAVGDQWGGASTTARSARMCRSAAQISRSTTADGACALASARLRTASAVAAASRSR